MGAMNPFLVQDHFRIRNDGTAADPGTPNWVSTEDQGTNVVINTDTMFRIRFVVSNTGTANATSSFDLYVSKNGGSYAAVTTASSNVKAVDAGDISSADATALTTGNFQLTAGTGTASNGEYDETGSADANLSNGNYFELEYAVSIVYADVADANTLDFRVYYGGSPLDSYSVTPRVEANKVTSTLTQVHTRIRSDSNTADGGTPTWETTEDQAAALSWAPTTNFRIRLILENTGGLERANEFRVYVSKNSGAYADITASSSNVQSADPVGGGSARFEISNFVLTAGAGEPLPGWYSAINSLNRDIAGNEYVEYDVGLTIVDADVAHNDTLDFRVYYATAALDAYSHTPRITVSKTTAYTLPVDKGSYSQTGQTTTLKRALVMPTNLGSYALTGNAITLSFAYNLMVDLGAYTLGGQTVTLLRAAAAVADSGLYSLAGQAVTFAYARAVPADLGSYSLTGFGPTLFRAKTMFTDLGTYTLGGQSVTFLIIYNLEPDFGLYSLTGQTAELLRTLITVIDLGTFTLSGQSVILAKSKLLAVDTGTYTQIGLTSQLIRDLILGVDQGVYTHSGLAPELDLSVPVSLGVYSMAGFEPELLYTPVGAYTLDVNLGTYSLNGGAPILVGLGGVSGLRPIDRRRRL